MVAVAGFDSRSGDDEAHRLMSSVGVRSAPGPYEWQAVPCAESNASVWVSLHAELAQRREEVDEQDLQRSSCVLRQCQLACESRTCLMLPARFM